MSNEKWKVFDKFKLNEYLKKGVPVLASTAQTLFDNDINGYVLSALTEKDLEQLDLTFGQRKQLWLLISGRWFVPDKENATPNPVTPPKQIKPDTSDVPTQHYKPYFSEGEMHTQYYRSPKGKYENHPQGYPPYYNSFLQRMPPPTQVYSGWGPINGPFTYGPHPESKTPCSFPSPKKTNNSSEVCDPKMPSKDVTPCSTIPLSKQRTPEMIPVIVKPQESSSSKLLIEDRRDKNYEVSTSRSSAEVQGNSNEEKSKTAINHTQDALLKRTLPEEGPSVNITLRQKNLEHHNETLYKSDSIRNLPSASNECGVDAAIKVSKIGLNTELEKRERTLRSDCSLDSKNGCEPISGFKTQTKESEAVLGQKNANSGGCKWEPKPEKAKASPKFRESSKIVEETAVIPKAKSSPAKIGLKGIKKTQVSAGSGSQGVAYPVSHDKSRSISSPKPYDLPVLKIIDITGDVRAVNNDSDIPRAGENKKKRKAKHISHNAVVLGGVNKKVKQNISKRQKKDTRGSSITSPLDLTVPSYPKTSIPESPRGSIDLTVDVPNSQGSSAQIIGPVNSSDNKRVGLLNRAEVPEQCRPPESMKRKGPTGIPKKKRDAKTAVKPVTNSRKSTRNKINKSSKPLSVKERKKRPGSKKTLVKLSKAGVVTKQSKRNASKGSKKRDDGKHKQVNIKPSSEKRSPDVGAVGTSKVSDLKKSNHLDHVSSKLSQSTLRPLMQTRGKSKSSLTSKKSAKKAKLKRTQVGQSQVGKEVLMIGKFEGDGHSAKQTLSKSAKDSEEAVDSVLSSQKSSNNVEVSSLGVSEAEKKSRIRQPGIRNEIEGVKITSDRCKVPFQLGKKPGAEVAETMEEGKLKNDKDISESKSQLKPMPIASNQSTDVIPNNENPIRCELAEPEIIRGGPSNTLDSGAEISKVSDENPKVKEKLDQKTVNIKRTGNSRNQCNKSVCTTPSTELNLPPTINRQKASFNEMKVHSIKVERSSSPLEHAILSQSAESKAKTEIIDILRHGEFQLDSMAGKMGGARQTVANVPVEQSNATDILSKRPSSEKGSSIISKSPINDADPPNAKSTGFEVVSVKNSDNLAEDKNDVKSLTNDDSPPSSSMSHGSSILRHPEEKRLPVSHDKQGIETHDRQFKPSEISSPVEKQGSCSPTQCESPTFCKIMASPDIDSESMELEDLPLEHSKTDPGKTRDKDLTGISTTVNLEKPKSDVSLHKQDVIHHEKKGKRYVYKGCLKSTELSKSNCLQAPKHRKNHAEDLHRNKIHSPTESLVNISDEPCGQGGNAIYYAKPVDPSKRKRKSKLGLLEEPDIRPKPSYPVQKVPRGRPIVISDIKPNLKDPTTQFLKPNDISKTAGDLCESTPRKISQPGFVAESSGTEKQTTKKPSAFYLPWRTKLEGSNANLKGGKSPPSKFKLPPRETDLCESNEEKQAKANEQRVVIIEKKSLDVISTAGKSDESKRLSGKRIVATKTDLKPVSLLPSQRQDMPPESWRRNKVFPPSKRLPNKRSLNRRWEKSPVTQNNVSSHIGKLQVSKLPKRKTKFSPSSNSMPKANPPVKKNMALPEKLPKVPLADKYSPKHSPKALSLGKRNRVTMSELSSKKKKQEDRSKKRKKEDNSKKRKREDSVVRVMKRKKPIFRGKEFKGRNNRGSQDRGSPSVRGFSRNRRDRRQRGRYGQTAEERDRKRRPGRSKDSSRRDRKKRKSKRGARDDRSRSISSESRMRRCSWSPSPPMAGTLV